MTFHTEVNIHSAAPPMPWASQSNGAVMTAPAASPAALQTSWITGTSQTPMIDSLDLLADVPEEVHQRHGGAADNCGAQRYENAELAATREVRVARVRA